MRNLFFVGLIPKPGTYYTHPHSHSIWETVYYTQGEGILNAGGQQIHFQPGDLVSVPPEMVHSESSEHGFMNIHFLFSEFQHAAGVLQAHDTENGDILNLLQFMYREFHLKPETRHHIPESLLETIGYYVTSQQAGKCRRSHVQSLEALIVANLTNPDYDVEKSMAEISQSPGYLRKLFKSELGLTPLQYLTQKRVEYAKKLLESVNEQNMKICDIAEMSGFTDRYYFSRVFSKVTGTCPQKWRKLPPDL